MALCEIEDTNLVKVEVRGKLHTVDSRENRLPYGARRIATQLQRRYFVRWTFMHLNALDDRGFTPNRH